ncbi:MAG TPA: AAC(3) family N-acetyltransferase [Crocinitomicaceae bacterium]|nr:AAC(3) family N-acetyltransferase [Crocinitomicaceae bacterium]
MRIKDFLRSITPNFLLEINRTRKKKLVNQQLKTKKEKGEVITKENLISDFQKSGISPGDTVLIHASMSKIGYLENGPQTFVEAIIEFVGKGGNVLMPSSPNAKMQLDFIREHPVFDVLNSPSRLGAISEYFRALHETKRSLNATEPVCAFGKNADYLTEGHFGEITPYTSNSPFARITEFDGKILYIGVTLDNAGTNLHTLEDAVEFEYPVYHSDIFEVQIIDNKGERHLTKTKVHNPEWSKKRKCDELLPLFKKRGVYTGSSIGNAKTLVFDAKKMLEVMKDEFLTNGVTMYHPKGKS